MGFISFYDLVIIVKEPVIAQDSRRFLSVSKGCYGIPLISTVGKRFFVDTHMYLHFCGGVSDEFSYFKSLILKNCRSGTWPMNFWRPVAKTQMAQSHVLIPVVQFPPETTQE